MKAAGFATGAGLAGLAVYGFYALTEVTDTDLLGEILSEHCLPYVQTGDTPFEGMGRTPGVYDEVNLKENLLDGGVLLIHGGRFVAQWGVAENLGPQGDTTFRICEVDPTYSDETIAGFVVDADSFVDLFSGIISPDGALRPSSDTMPAGPTVFGWFNANGDQSDGLRVVMTLSAGLVSSVGVVIPLEE